MAETARNSGAGEQPDAAAHRLPPQDLEAEMSLLGSMMLSREAVGEVIPIIGPGETRWLYRPDHRILFETLLELYDGNKPIDLVVVRDELRRREALEQVGGVDYIVRCAESVPSALHVEHYARIVRDKGLLRDLIACVSGIADDAHGSVRDAAELLDLAEQKLFNVTERRISGASVRLADLIRQIHEQFNSSDDHQITGLSSGFSELDDLTTGFQPGDMIIVAGRPSMGKTALGLNMAEHAAVEEGRPVAFFSMEMSCQQVAQRLLCSRGRVDSHKFRKRILNEHEKNQIVMTCAELEHAPLFVDDTPGMTAMELRAKARRLRVQKGIEAVFVDYLQLMHCPGAENRQQEIATISRALKALGRELSIPIIALAQLNRMTEGRTGNEPRMSDLRESGAIEQDADVVLLIHREEYYKRDDADLRGKAKLILAKQRNGPTANIDLMFDHQSTRFFNYSPVDEPAYASSYGGETPF